MDTRVRHLRGGGRFTVTVEGDPPAVVKRGDAAALFREARALRHLAGTGWAPHLRGISHGRLETAYLPGAARDLTQLSAVEARGLGALVRAVHDHRRTVTSRRSEWRSPARSLAGYWSARAADRARYTPPHLRSLAARIAGTSPASDEASRPPFRLLHGDLTAANILWGPHPRLVDWEFWRMGDPAEDLAYLMVVNNLPEGIGNAVIVGYGDPTVASRIDPWRAPCALDAGLWYLAAGLNDEGLALVERARALSGARPGAAARRRAGAGAG